MPLTVLLFPLLLLLLTAAVTDLRTRRIPNWLNGLVAVTGFVQCLSWEQSLAPGWLSLAGFGVGILLNLPLWLLGLRGGGDLKLFAGVGAWLGPVNVVAVFIVATIMAMVVAVLQALLQRRLRQVAVSAATSTVGLMHGGSVPDEDSSSAEQDYARRHVPYAVPVLVSVLAMLCWS